MNKYSVLVTAPSLDPSQNVSGVSSVVKFLIDNNDDAIYEHFELGKKDKAGKGLSRLTNTIAAFKRWKKVLDGKLAGSSDVIVHYSFPLSGPSILRDPLFMREVLRRKMKMIVHIHGGLFLTASWTPWILKRILKYVFSWDVVFVVLSEMERDILQKKYGAKRVEVLPNCVDLHDAEKFMQEGERTACDGRPLRLGYLGRLVRAKGMRELLDACVILKKEGIPFVLDFAGKEATEGQYLPSYERELGDNFHYSGLVSGEKKNQFLRNLDVFVMPSYFEGLPISMLECMSYGVVPVVTPVGSIPTVVDGIKECSNPNEDACKNSNGIFVKRKDVGSIVDAIKYLHKNRIALNVLGSNARATVFKEFSVEAYISKLNELYDSL